MNPQNLRFGSGQAVRRLEDEQLLKGAGVYTDDVSLPGQTRLCFVRSPYPHARIVSIDTSAAKAMPGVHLVVTGAELKAQGVKPMARPVNFKRADGSPPASPDRHILAAERVRFVGEAIAMIVADTLEAARDAAALPMSDLVAALDGGAPDPLLAAMMLKAGLKPGAMSELKTAPRGYPKDHPRIELRAGEGDAAVAAIEQARARLAANVAPALVLEAMLIQATKK